MSKNQKGGVEDCNGKYRYVHPWIFTTQPYGVSVSKMLCEADKCGSSCCECKDCEESTGTVEAKVESQAMTFSDDQIRNSFTAMLDAVGKMDLAMKSMQAKIEQLEKRH